MLSVRSAVVGAVASLGMACGFFLGLEEPQGKPLPDAAPPVRDPCAHLEAPGEPSTEDDGPAVPTFWLALRNSYIGESVTQPGTPVPGFDLDRACTCDRAPTAAHDGGDSCVTRNKTPPICDDDGGVDNAVERVLGGYASIFNPNHFVERISNGEKNILIYVADYNGKANDLSVSVGFAASDGLFTDECNPDLVVNTNPAGAPASSGQYNVSWRGCDKWHGVPSQFLGDPSVPKSYVPKQLAKGYVRDHTLIMTGAANVPVFFGDSISSVQDPSLVAPLVAVPTLHPSDPQRYRIDHGVLAGRLPFADLANVAFNTTYNGFYTCQNLATYQSLMGALCAGVDLTDSRTLDYQGKSCTSMSFAFRFDADLADLDFANRTPTPSGDNPCAGQTPPPIDTLCPP